MNENLHAAYMAAMTGEALPEQQRAIARELLRVQGRLYAMEKRAGIPEYDCDFYRADRSPAAGPNFGVPLSRPRE